MKHKFYECPPSCERVACQFCDGGLSFCITCKCGEGSLPTDCPGEQVTDQTESDIYNRKIDFIENEGWVKL
jgi:hypothetical protein